MQPSYPIKPWSWILLLMMSGSLACGESEEKPVSLSNYLVEEGYELAVVAAEPLIEAPVAIDFDHRGRIWVAEMRSYMTNLDALEEEQPISRIVILSDQDEDGRMDQAKVFLDSLVLPRALRLYQGGLLYAEPPNLWWVEITADDQPGERVLVDSLYAEAGNVEHMSNGLEINLDNWIYNAKSNLRYRYRHGQWERSFTAKRGQWGITHDDQGRLYYNHNSTLILGDRGLPQAPLQQTYARPRHSLHAVLPDHQRLYPVHANWVNRGYQEGVLDSVGKLRTPTSACGPLIFRGDALPLEDQGQAFICIPEANLIKRLTLQERDGLVYADNAKAGPEFLASTDPYFRPVTLKNAPDGALYVVDMHRGVIQHQAYMTGYLREKLADTQADTVIHRGRILALSRAGEKHETPFDWRTASAKELVSTLAHPNGWRRDRAQQELIYRQANVAIPALRELLAQEKERPALHAFWTLEGLGALPHQTLQAALDHPATSVNQAALYVLAENDWSGAGLTWQHLYQQGDPALDRYLALALPQLLPEEAAVATYWQELAARHPADSVLPEYALSGLGEQWPSSAPDGWQAGWQRMVQAQHAHEPNPELVASQQATDNRTLGLVLYRRHCSGCHGVDGRGQANLAPPLIGSSYVSGPAKELGMVMLYGLRRSMHQGDAKGYPAAMPGFGQNDQLSTTDIAHLMSYLRNAFSQAPPWIDPATIDTLRQIPWPSGQTLTETELKALLTQHAEDSLPI